MSVTTRQPRPREIDGVHYYFVDDAEFERLRGAGEFLEWAVVHGRAKYGTPRGPVDRALAEGRKALLEIDLQGARQVRERMPEAAVRVPRAARAGTSSCAGWSVGAPRPRRSGRSACTAREELAARREFDVSIVNDDVRRASEELVSLMRAPSSTAPHDGQRPVMTPPPQRNETDRVRYAGCPEGITNPPIDDLLTVADSKYALVIYSAKRARQINAYYSQLSEGLLEYVGPLVETSVHEKPMSIALREINEGLLTSTAIES